MFLLFSCSSKESVEKISWIDELDYFTSQEVFYFVDVGSNSAYIGGILDIYKMIDNSYVDRITVSKFEIQERSDGYPICRIWGISGGSGKINYLLARNWSLQID